MREYMVTAPNSTYGSTSARILDRTSEYRSGWRNEWPYE